MQPPISPTSGPPHITLFLAGKTPVSKSPPVTASNEQAPVTPAHLEAKQPWFQAWFNRKPGTSSAGEASQPGRTFASSFTSADEKLKSLAPFSSAGGPSASSPHTEETNNPRQRKWMRPFGSPSSSRPDKAQRKVADVYCTALRAVLDNKVKKNTIREKVKELNLTSVTAQDLAKTIEEVASDKEAKCKKLNISKLDKTLKNARRVVIPINGTPPKTLVFKREKKDGEFTPWRLTDASKWHSISVAESPEDYFEKLQKSNEGLSSVNVVIVRKKKQPGPPPIPPQQISPSMAHFSDDASTPEQLVDTAEEALGNDAVISAEATCKKALDKIGARVPPGATLSDNDFDLSFRALQVQFYCQVKRQRPEAAMQTAKDLFELLKKRAPQRGTEEWTSLQAWRYLAARALFDESPPYPAKAVELLLETKKDMENWGDDCKKKAEYAVVLQELVKAPETEVMLEGMDDKSTLKSKFNACYDELSPSEIRRYDHLRAAFKETVVDEARPHSYNSDSSGSYLAE